MAAELMLINPRRRRRHRKARVTHARRNPRRRRSRRMSALQQQYFGKGRRRRSSRRRRVIHARSNPRRRHRRRSYIIRARRNPSVANPVGFVSETLVPAAIGAVGGVGVNYIFDNYAPVSLQTGILNPLSRFALAAGLGMVVGMATDNRTGAMVAAGAMTVTAYDMLNNFMSGQGVFASTSQQGGGQGGQQMGRLVNRRMGRFLGRGGMGYMSPAAQIARFG